MTWPATQAKAKFSEVLDKAETEGPQVVRRRKREFYVLTKEQFEDRNKSSGKKDQRFVSAWDALKPSFKARYDVEFPRLRGKSRKADLG
jgi:prevent-host-death family protein